MRTITARLDLDKRCNMRCIYCQNKDAHHPADSFFPLDRLESVLPVLSRYCWSVYISCGGEPLIHPQFGDAIRLVDRYLGKTETVMVTNGLALSASYRKIILDSTLMRMQISIHSVDSKIYSRLYGCTEKAYSSVVENVSALVKERGQRKWPKIIITSIAMKSTIKHFPELAEWICQIGADGMRVEWLIPHDTPGMQYEVIERNAETIAILRQTEQILSQHGKMMIWPFALGLTKIVSGIKAARLTRLKFHHLMSMVLKYLDARKRNSCRLAGRLITINKECDAEINPCEAIRLPHIKINPSTNLAKEIRCLLKKTDFSKYPACRDNCPQFSADYSRK